MVAISDVGPLKTTATAGRAPKSTVAPSTRAGAGEDHVGAPAGKPLEGRIEVRLGGGDGAVMVKLALPTSKKTLPTQETRTRACDVACSARSPPRLPSFAVEACRMVGKVAPPSIERSIATLAQEIGAAVVPATFQVTVCGLLPNQLTAVFGASPEGSRGGVDRHRGALPS